MADCIKLLFDAKVIAAATAGGRDSVALAVTPGDILHTDQDGVVLLPTS
ncbi:hypothetical protein [Streptomyces sp. NEAU-S77]